MLIQSPERQRETSQSSPSRQCTQAQPADGRPWPGGDDDDNHDPDDHDGDDEGVLSVALLLPNTCPQFHSFAYQAHHI